MIPWFVDHHHCRLGKGYRVGDSQASFTRLPSYQGLDAPHARVLQATKRGFDQLAHSGLGDTTAIARDLQEMERGSQVVFESLERILAEKSKRR